MLPSRVKRKPVRMEAFHWNQAGAWQVRTHLPGRASEEGGLQQWESSGGPRGQVGSGSQRVTSRPAALASPVSLSEKSRVSSPTLTYWIGVSGDGQRGMDKLFRWLSSTIKVANPCCRGTKELDEGFGGRVRELRCWGRGWQVDETLNSSTVWERARAE